MKKLYFLILVLLVLSSCSSKKEAVFENDAAGNDADSESTDISQNDSNEDVPDESNVPDEKNEPDKDAFEQNDEQSPNDDDAVITPCDDVWTDDTSGLMWENCPKLFQGNWSDSIKYCENLVHGGFDDWRLPTLSELRSLVRGCLDAVTGGTCNATDECLNEENCMNHPCSVPNCDYQGGPANGCYRDSSVVGECDYHWSSKESATYNDSAWYVDFMNGVINPTEKSWKELYGRCVRTPETEENDDDDDEISDDVVEQEPFSINIENIIDGENSYKIYTASA